MFVCRIDTMNLYHQTKGVNSTLLENVSTRRYAADMKENNFPSDKLDKFMLRFPEGMRERVREASELNGRSMNSEIIHRLEQSFLETTNRQHGELSADMARQLAKNARENLLSNAKDYVQQEIARTVCIGLNELVVDLTAIAGIPDDHELDEDADAQLFAEYIYPLIEYLTVLGFSVEFDGEMLKVAF